MKKLFAFCSVLLVIFAFMFSMSADANSFREVKVVGGSSLVVKEQPASSAQSTATLKRGDFVTVFSTINGWSYMQSGEQKGYVVASFLATPKSTIKIASSKGGLVVKETPSRAANTLATLQYNMIVEDFGSVGDGWSFVQYGNVTGYVVSTFIGTPKTTAKTTKEEVYVRNIASKSGAVHATLNGGTRVNVHSTIAGWAYISSGTTRGYVEATKLADVKNMTVAYAKDYLPACPKTYTFVHVITWDNETDNGMETYHCQIKGATRSLQATDYYLSQHYTLNESKMFIHYFEGHDEFHFPLKQNDMWTFIGYGETKRTMKVLSLNETVTTPSGTYFNVIKIMEQAEYGTTYYYLAPGNGIIKTESKANIDGSSYEGTIQLYSYN